MVPAKYLLKERYLRYRALPTYLAGERAILSSKIFLAGENLAFGAKHNHGWPVTDSQKFLY